MTKFLLNESGKLVKNDRKLQRSNNLKIGPKIKIKKTETVFNNYNQLARQRITIKNETLERVEKYTYIGQVKLEFG